MRLDPSSRNLSVAITLVTLALCALFLAQGTTSLVAGSLFPLESATTMTAASKATGSAPGMDPPDSLAILQRNIFDPTTGPLPRPDEPETDVVVEGDAQELEPGAMPPPCEGSLKLVASVYAEKYPEWSFATVSTGSGAPLLYRQGQELDSQQLEAIFPKAIFLKATTGSLCSVELFSDRTPAKSTKKPVASASTSAKKPSTIPARKGSIPQEELEKSITKISDTKYTIQRSLVDKLLENQAELMRSARIVPHEQNGQVVGVKLYGIRRRSLLGQLGLQNGDTLRTINGYDMSSPDSALEAYSRLRNASSLTISLTRRGRAVNMDYQIQ